MSSTTLSFASISAFKCLSFRSIANPQRSLQDPKDCFPTQRARSRISGIDWDQLQSKQSTAWSVFCYANEHDLWGRWPSLSPSFRLLTKPAWSWVLQVGFILLLRFVLWIICTCAFLILSVTDKYLVPDIMKVLIEFCKYTLKFVLSLIPFVSQSITHLFRHVFVMLRRKIW